MSHDIKIGRAARARSRCSPPIADYALELRDQERARPTRPRGYCLMDTLACGFQALKYPACTKLLGPVVPGRDADGRRARARHLLRARSGQGGLQHRRDDSLARFQRHLARRRVGPSVRQSRRHSRGRRLSVARAASRCHGARRAHRHDQGARDPGRARAREQLQPRRARSRAAGARRLDRRGRRRCSAAPAIRSSTPCRMPGSTAGRCAPTAMRPIPARARAGRPAMRPAAPCAIALFALKGEMGYPSALSAKTWGFQDVLFKGKPLGSAAALRQLRDGERAVQDLLSGRVSCADRGRGGDDAARASHATSSGRSSASSIETQEPGVRIIDKTGPLANPADRDHCIQYMVAIPLMFGRLTAADYEDEVAARSAHRCAARQDAGAREPALHAGILRGRTSATSATPCRCSSRTARPAARVQVDYPIGHRKRRAEGMPVLVKKFEASVAAHFGAKQTEAIKRMFADRAALAAHAGQRLHGAAGERGLTPAARHRLKK